MLSDTSLGLKFGDIWFNAPPHRAVRGVAEGRSLASLLGGTAAKLPWNVAWGGKPAVTTDDVPFLEVPTGSDGPRITLLSPNPQSLATLFRVWDAELKKLVQREVPVPQPSELRGASVTLEALANKITETDRAPANGSSIAILLEHRGVSVLLGADAHPTVLAPALKALAVHRKVRLPMQVDVFKLSHHASRANITVDLMRTVQAKHYIVSTNGSIFGHPDDEAMARVILEGGSQRKIWFNYRTDRTAKWGDADLQSKYRFEAGLPITNGETVSIELAGSSTRVTR